LLACVLYSSLGIDTMSLLALHFNIAMPTADKIVQGNRYDT
jgi:hypothetical protein